MRLLTALFSILSFFGGVMILLEAKSAIHEILAGVLFVLWALFMCAAAVLDLLERQGKAREQQAENTYNAILSLARNIGRKKNDLD
jgi:hypothetical protein